MLMCVLGPEGEYNNPDGCFSAEATVRIQESATPVTMRELKTAQHVECLDSGADMLAPTTTRYCEVMAWVSQ